MKTDMDENNRKKKEVYWINIQNLFFLIVFLVFFITVVWSDQISMLVSEWKQQDYSITPTITTLPVTPTPLPSEWLTAPTQTNGVIIGGLVLVLIVLVSTFVIMACNKKR
ncbi:MAG TPA: hypothetical protein G4N92_03435 [Anaerolineae bacterium]|nr:hypothetical protein [Anaerolineae bacterium]